MRRFSGLSDERGATLVVVTLATLLLFGFAALAVDVGHGMGERRRAQSTADASVLAAAVEVSFGGITLQDLVDQALAFADSNAPSPIPDEAWLNDCPDSANPADQLEFTANELGLVPATDCVSFSTTFSRIRVSLPQQDVDTFFAGVIGIDSFDVTAFAEATISLPGEASTPPFLVLAGVEGGAYVCLRDAPSGTKSYVPPMWVGNGRDADPTLGYEPTPDEPDPVPPLDPCDDDNYLNDSQFFGAFRPHVYANWPDDCGAGPIAAYPNTQVFAQQIAEGIDHPFSSFWPNGYSGDPATERIDGFGCLRDPSYAEPFPNTVLLQAGNVAQALERGLLSGGNQGGVSYDGRLEDAGSSTSFAGYAIDNLPIWAYLHKDVGSWGDVPLACTYVAQNSGPDGQPEPGYDYFDLRAAMTTCLYDVGRPGYHGPVIFAKTADEGRVITTTTRFAFVPQIHEKGLTRAELQSGRFVHIDNFVPVFIQKLYQRGSEPSGAVDDYCFTVHPHDVKDSGKQDGWFMHEAGQNYDHDCGKGGGQQVDMLASLVIPCKALPTTICIDDGKPGSPAGQPVLVIELTK